jgi:hypothetical protein
VTFLLRTPVPHRCAVPHDNRYFVGTNSVWQCNNPQCLRIWVLRDQPFQGRLWVPLRWWHFKARRLMGVDL